MTKREVMQRFRAGQVVRVTNHYITRTDHPCFGTNERTIERVTSSHLWFTSSGGVEFPKARQIEGDAGGAVRFYGGGAGQQPGDLFLTFEWPAVELNA